MADDPGDPTPSTGAVVALPEIQVDFSRRDEEGRVLLDKADLSFYSDPEDWKGFFVDGTKGAVGTIEKSGDIYVARLSNEPFDITS